MTSSDRKPARAHKAGDSPQPTTSAERGCGPAPRLSDERVREVVRLLNVEISTLDAHPFAAIATALGEAREELLRLRREELARAEQDKIISAALGPDASGRPLADLLRKAAELFEEQGGGPLAYCLRGKAADVEAALETNE